MFGKACMLGVRGQLKGIFQLFKHQMPVSNPVVSQENLSHDLAGAFPKKLELRRLADGFPALALGITMRRGSSAEADKKHIAR